MMPDVQGIAPIGETVGLVRGGRCSAREICDERLDRIARAADLGAFWLIDEDGARRDADRIDALVAAGRDPGPLAGVPVAYKDSFDVAGLPTTAGVPFLGAGPAAADAPQVARLRAAGAVCLGKLAMHQFAWGMTGQTPGRPPCRNPVDHERIPGGSSSGSAVAVAAGLVDVSPGTDTGGSIRNPSATCGIVGLMATKGVVSLDGIVPFSHTLDHGGPLARTVDDCARAFAVLADRALDTTVADLGRLRLATPRPWFFDGIDDAIASVVEVALRRIAEQARIVDVDLGWQHDPTCLGLLYDTEALTIAADPVLADPDAYEPNLPIDLRKGLGASARDYLEVLERIEARRRQALPVFDEADVLLTPAQAIATPRLSDPDLTTTMNRTLKPFNGLDWPSLVLPCGHDRDGLPVGLQLTAAPFREDLLLRVGRALERLLA